MTVEVRVVTDPACAWSWASEPKLRRLDWEFGDELDWRLVMGGMAREIGRPQRERYARIWPEVAEKGGMPIDARIWTRGGLHSSYPPCQAVVAACEQGSDVAARYLRLVREGIMYGRKPLDHISALVAEAETLGDCGLDFERFRIDVRSNAIVEGFAAHLEEARRIPEQAIAENATGCTGPIERVTFPSLTFVDAGGTRRGVYGWQPYELYLEVATASGATPKPTQEPTPLELIDRFGRCATREIEEITGRSRIDVEAELWGLARDGALNPVPAMTGTLWERA